MEEPLNIWVIKAQPMENHRLRLAFNNGSVRCFDCKPLIEQYPVFHALRDETVFRNITLDGWTVTWANGTIDIAPEYLYEHGVRPDDADEESPLPCAAEEGAVYGSAALA